MNPKKQPEELKRHPHHLSECLNPTKEELLTVFLED